MAETETETTNLDLPGILGALLGPSLGDDGTMESPTCSWEKEDVSGLGLGAPLLLCHDFGRGPRQKVMAQ